MYMYNWYHSNVSSILYIHEYRLQCTTIHGAFPLLAPLCSPFNPLLLTWNPPSCDRIRPPRSQVACKLTSPVPTLSPTPPTLPLQIPSTPVAQRLTKTTSGQSGVFYPEQYVSNRCRDTISWCLCLIVLY
jgi:hypothetical protein